MTQTLSSHFSYPILALDLDPDSWRWERCRFTNDYWEVRLRHVKGELDLNSEYDRRVLEELYAEWLVNDEYVVVKKTTSQIPALGHSVKVEYQACKARKRGNDVDAYRIDRRLHAIRDGILEYARRGQPFRSTNVVYVTGTIDPQLVENDLELAWRSLGYWFNMFLANLRKHGFTPGNAEGRESRSSDRKVHVYRSWEPHESGWPHFHAILCFEGRSLSIFQDARSKWRVKDKRMFEDSWRFGWIDVVALTPGTVEKNVERVVRYVTKYMGKGVADGDYRLVGAWPNKKLLTESILWCLGMRSYSVSRGLVGVSGRIADLKKRTSIIQRNLEDLELEVESVTWEFIGMVRRTDTELTQDDWSKLYSDPPNWIEDCWKPYFSSSGSAVGNEWLSRGS